MASKAPSPQSDPNYWSPEKCREFFADCLSGPTQVSIPDWQMQVLEKQIADYCEHGVHVTPFEEFEKELLEELL